MKNIVRATKKISFNLKKMHQKEEVRCAANLAFLERLSRNNEMIKFLRFLHKEINTPQFKAYLKKNSIGFVQMVDHLRVHSMGAIDDHDIIGVVAEHHIMAQLDMESDELDPLTNGEMDKLYNANKRTAKEIGKGHIDSNKAALKLDEDYKFDEMTPEKAVEFLSAFIERMIDHLKNDNKELTERELKAVQILIKYRVRITKMNYVLKITITRWKKFIEKIDEALKHNAAKLKACHQKIEDLLKAWKGFIKARKEKQQDCDDQIARIKATIKAIERAIKIYTNRVYSADPKYKKRVADYIKDSKFDETFDEFERRKSIGEIKNFNPKEGTSGSILEIISGKTYVIKSKKFGSYLQSAAGDKIDFVADDHVYWIITEESAGIYSVLNFNNRVFLSFGTIVVNSVAHNKG
jgi:hypothetical protein